MHIIVIKGQTNMYCEEIDNKYISLAWKLGLHPTTLARLSSITSSYYEKWVPNWPLYHQEEQNLHIIVIKGQTNMYCEEIDNKYISLAWKLGLHPTTLARLSSITSSYYENWVPNWLL